MKKVFIFIALCLLVVGCGANKKNSNNTSNNTKKVKSEGKYLDDNSMPIAIYNINSNKLIKISDYKAAVKNGEDIASFQVFPSTNETIVINNSFPLDFYNTWQDLDENKNHNIGFNLKYSLKSGRHISQNILNPSDTMKDDYYNYIIVYLYDDYAHIGDSWYSHIETDEYNDDTYFTTIKLYANGMAHEIDSNIILTVFTYDGIDDFDGNNEYRGNSKYSINILNP